MSASVAGEVPVQGKVAVVTGANTGIGKVTALELARRKARVLCLCRSEARGRAAVDEIRDETGNDAVEYVHLDLASFASVRACAETVLAKVREIDLLVLNAGLAGQPGLTADGFELTFGVNHLGVEPQGRGPPGNGLGGHSSDARRRRGRPNSFLAPTSPQGTFC